MKYVSSVVCVNLRAWCVDAISIALFQFHDPYSRSIQCTAELIQRSGRGMRCKMHIHSSCLLGHPRDDLVGRPITTSKGPRGSKLVYGRM